MAGFLAALLPSLIGVAGSLLGGKGKKQQYTTTQNAQQQQAYSQLLKMIMQKMSQQSPAQAMGGQSLNQLSQMFYGKPYQMPQNTARPSNPTQAFIPPNYQQ
jgi:hypothetical protein